MGNDPKKIQAFEMVSLRWLYINTIGTIDEKNRAAVVQWLSDRSAFHIWFTSIVTGCFIVLTLFGRYPDFGDLGGKLLTLSLLLLLGAIICNLICVWAIPTWKYGVQIGVVHHGRNMRLDLSITAWIAMTFFLAGLVLAFVGNFAS